MRVLNNIRGASAITIPSNTTPFSFNVPFWASMKDESYLFDSGQVNLISVSVTSEDETMVRKAELNSSFDPLNVIFSNETFPFETVNTLPVERGDTFFEGFPLPTNVISPLTSTLDVSAECEVSPSISSIVFVVE